MIIFGYFHIYRRKTSMAVKELQRQLSRVTSILRTGHFWLNLFSILRSSSTAESPGSWGGHKINRTIITTFSSETFEEKNKPLELQVCLALPLYSVWWQGCMLGGESILCWLSDSFSRCLQESLMRVTKPVFCSPGPNAHPNHRGHTFSEGNGYEYSRFPSGSKTVIPSLWGTK